MNDTDATLVAAYARSWTRSDRARLPALVAEDATLDYAALHERVARAAGALRAAGVAAGDFVAVAMERSLEQLIAILGAMAAGACPCPLEPRLADEETARRVAAVGLGWVLHDPAHAGTAAASGCRPSACCPPRAWRGASLSGRRRWRRTRRRCCSSPPAAPAIPRACC
ncbi:AMP-binding protein [Achromobacter xylosoxidans]